MNLKITRTNKSTFEPQLIDDAFNGSIGGVVVEDFLQQDMCKKLISIVDKGDDPNLVNKVPWGEIYGTVLVNADHNTAYYKNAKSYEQQLTSNDFNFNELVNNFLYPNTDKLKAFRNSDGDYFISTIRKFEPNKGGLHAHAEREFLENLPAFAEIKRSCNLDQHLNILLILQEAEKGGQLYLYDLTWENTPQSLKVKNEFYNHYETREHLLKAFPKQSVELKSGDLLIFNGTNIWHEVEEVKGSKCRYSLASFLTVNSSNNEMIIYN